MQKQMPTSYQETARKIENVRRIYSKIGEPLPADIIVDLYRHLGTFPNFSMKKSEREKTC